MTKTTDVPRLETGVTNLDKLLPGGFPRGSVTVLAGPPGSGKTILAQQFCFHNAANKRALYFTTLSEPTAKTLRYLTQFSFFDPAKLDSSVTFIDLGVILHAKGLAETAKLVMEQVKRLKPSIVVIDSFKVFDDLAESREELRKFGYELAVELMAWEVTALLLGEYAPSEIATNPLFSIVDGLLLVTQREQSGEQQRFVQLLKMRGTNHSRDEHPFVITTDGIQLFAPRLMLQRVDAESTPDRLKTGISRLDELMGEGIARGSSLLVAGVAGTGKTALLLEFVYRGAAAGEKGIIFSFEETSERLRAAARGLGLDIDRELERGMLEIVFIPQPDILVEQHLLMMAERIERAKARRVAVDSLSVFLHRVDDPRICREKTFHLASIVHNAGAVGLFATDIPYGSTQISRFGVEETVVDGILLLTSTEERYERERYVEVYKLRGTAHSKGRHNMVIGKAGLEVYPRAALESDLAAIPEPVEPRRLTTGVSGLDALVGGGLLRGSATLLSGDTGCGKTTAALQFVTEGASRGEPGLFVAFEESKVELVESAAGLRMPLAAAVEDGMVHIVSLSRGHVRANQLLTILTDKIRVHGARRVSLDSASYILKEGLPPLDARRVLRGLIARFKALGVTSLVTLEAQSGAPPEPSDLFSLLDNVIVLRQAWSVGLIRPTLTVLKTRASAHDFGEHYLAFADGGLSVDERVGAPRAARPAATGRKKASRKARASRR
jgi:circadian clock protein KaiC